MKTTKWWDLAFGLGLPVLALIAWMGYSPTPWAHWGGVIVLTVLGGCYVAFGRRALRNEAPAVPFVLVLIVSCGLATAFSPPLATLQALALPFVWVVIDRTRNAIAFNIALVVSVAVGFLFSLGFSVDSATQAIVTEVLSLGFSLALGLWITRLVEDGKEHERLLDELRSVQNELAVANREAGVASERERIAREIHDTIAQSLTSLVMLAQRAHGELDLLELEPATATRPTAAAGAARDATLAPTSVLPSAQPTAHPTAAALESIDLIETTARDALTEARSLVAALAPVHVGDSSLTDVINRLAGRFNRETGVRVSASVAASAVPRELEVVLLRCAQEGLANIRKHAQASEAQVVISRNASTLQLTVRDNGCGLGEYSPQEETGFGLGGMRDRVALVGGSLDVSGEPGTGTTLTVTIPMTSEAAA